MGGQLEEKSSHTNKWWKLFKEIYSSALLIFSTVICMALIFTDNTTVSAGTHPAVAFCVLWAALLWLSWVEGGQASLVGLPPVAMELYKESHPTTHKIMSVVNKGDNLDRYLMGRQFMVLALVFVESLCTHAVDGSKPILGMPIMVNKILVDTGLAVFFMTAMIAKISAQVNASRCMLDYVNNFGNYFTFQTARLIEASGLLHCCYPVQMFFSWVSGQPLLSNEAPRNLTQSLFYWTRVLVSAAILVFSFSVTLYALFNGQTTMWEGVPNGVAVVLFFIFMAIVGMLEGMQIAFFAVAKMPEEDRAKSAWAKRTCDVLFANGGRNLPGFMVGRQLCVTLCFFIVARVTTIKLEEGEENIFGVSDGVQALFETGLLGALITTIVASITWQLVASAFPMAFLSTPITFVLLKIALAIEWTGIAQGSWIIALVHRKIVGYQRDEVYIGTAEERAANARTKGDESLADDASKSGPAKGHLGPYIPILPRDFGPRMNTLSEIEDLEQELTHHMEDVQARLAHLAEEKAKLQAAENDLELATSVEQSG